MAFGKKELGGIIKDALQELGTGDISFSVERPQDLAHGDYATNVALIACKKLGTPPKECAEKIVTHIKKGDAIKQVDIAGPGFINFFLSDDVIREYNKSAHEIKTTFSGKNVLVEHSSPNLFKPFSIGHLMNNIIGEFIARATKEGGAEVVTMSFPSDVSLSIAKALYILLKERENGVAFEKDFNNTKERVAYFGKCYAKGVSYFDEHPDEIKKAKDLSAIIHNTNHRSNERGLFEEIRSINNDYLRNEVLKDFLDSKIDYIVYESDVMESGLTIVKNHIGSVFKESEGAIVYVPDESRKDLNTTVFINSDGYPTYEAKDLGLIEIKFTKFNPDTSFFITDNEQSHHFKVVLDAASKLGTKWSEWAEKSIHIPHGRMTFKGEKMSSRLGGVPLALDVIAIVEDEVREKAGEKIEHLGIEDKKKLEREIALSALRIAVLRAKPGLNINFDPETSLSFEGDSGPYLLYTHARCCSLLDKGKERGYTPKFGNIELSSLERELIHFEEELSDSIETLSPQKLVAELFSIAQAFNSFYGREQILSDDKERSEHNLAIVARTRDVLRRGLFVLGIEAPERM
jgi:arginyl-tRNA synthetase